jgi:hypothetical protein
MKREMFRLLVPQKGFEDREGFQSNILWQVEYSK